MLITPTLHNIVVFGGTGFIGRHVVARLAAAGHRICVPTRQREGAKALFLLPRVDVISADIFNPVALDALLRRQTVVINLIGVLHGGSAPRGRPYSARFDRPHVQWPKQLGEHMVQAGISRLIHLSALGASSQAPSQYLRSKAEGERLIQSQTPLAATIFQPSVVFGPGDQFLNLFARLARWLPLLSVPSPQSRLQPIYVQDVAAAVHYALDHPETAGQCVPLAGPEVWTLQALMRFAALESGHARPVVGLPSVLAKWQARVLECLPGDPLMSRDNLDSLKLDSVVQPPVPPDWSLPPLSSLRAVAPDYLRGVSPRQQRVNAAREHHQP